jgi:hypothetical protein
MITRIRYKPTCHTPEVKFMNTSYTNTKRKGQKRSKAVVMLGSGALGRPGTEGMPKPKA